MANKTNNIRKLIRIDNTSLIVIGFEWESEGNMLKILNCYETEMKKKDKLWF